MGGGGPPLGGICPVFPESLFFNSKARFGVQDENLKKSRLQDSFCVNFKSVLCQSYVNFMPKKPAFFLHGLDPAPSPFDIVKKMQDWYGGTSLTNDNATKVRSVEDLYPRKKLV